MKEREAPICINCKHLIQTEGWTWKCAAFPDAIPEEIVNNIADHRQPFEGDNNIRYLAVIDGMPMPHFGPKKKPKRPAGARLDV